MADTHREIAARARRKVLDLIYRAQTSHIGSNFSCIEILESIYAIANVDKDLLPDRDRVILSKGWAAAAAYFFLAEKGIITQEELDSFCQPGSKLIGLVEPSVRGIEAAGGAMGHGLPIAVGMALAAKKEGSKRKVFVLMSDGEMDCGTTWESAAIASHHKLDNLIVVIDYNKWQATGRKNEVLNCEPLDQKWDAFGWEVREVKDGHNPEVIRSALTYPLLHRDRPIAVICHTVKGRGVSFMEDQLLWHYKNVDEESYQKAIIELNEKIA